MEHLITFKCIFKLSIKNAMIVQTSLNKNKRAHRALGRSPEEAVKGQGEAIILL